VFPAASASRTHRLDTLQHYSVRRSCASQGIGLRLLPCIGGTTPARPVVQSVPQPAAHTGPVSNSRYSARAKHDVSRPALVLIRSSAFPPPGPEKHPGSALSSAGDTDSADDRRPPGVGQSTPRRPGAWPLIPAAWRWTGGRIFPTPPRPGVHHSPRCTGPKHASASYGDCETIPTIQPAGRAAVRVSGSPRCRSLGLVTQDGRLDPITRQPPPRAITSFFLRRHPASSCPNRGAARDHAGNGLVEPGLPVTSLAGSCPVLHASAGTVLYTTARQPRTVSTLGVLRVGPRVFTPGPTTRSGRPG